MVNGFRAYGLVLLLASACGGKSGKDGPSGAECEPIAEDIGETPRADRNLELLALKHSEGFVADQAVYDRVVHDVSGIRALEPAVADVQYWPPYEPSTLLLWVSEDTLDRMERGDYTAWDCLNSTFRAIHIEYSRFTLIDDQLAELTFEGVVEPVRVSELYGVLPEIRRAGPSWLGGDGPTICLTTGGDAWHYVFDRAGGDCPAGCTEHEYYYFVSSGDGSVATARASMLGRHRSDLHNASRRPEHRTRDSPV